MKKTVILILVLSLAVIGGVSIHADAENEIPNDVLLCAQQEAGRVAEMVSRDPKHWGFSNADEIARLKLGDGFPVAYVGAEELRAAGGESLIQTAELRKNTVKHWVFTLDADGTAKLFITIAKENGSCILYHFGGNAVNFGKAQDIMERQMREKAGYEGRLGLVSAGGIFYFTASADTGEWVLPVVPVSQGVQETSGKPVQASVIVAQLQQIQRDSVPGQRG